MLTVSKSTCAKHIDGLTENVVIIYRVHITFPTAHFHFMVYVQEGRQAGVYVQEAKRYLSFFKYVYSLLWNNQYTDGSVALEENSDTISYSKVYRLHLVP